MSENTSSVEAMGKLHYRHSDFVPVPHVRFTCPACCQPMEHHSVKTTSWGKVECVTCMNDACARKGRFDTVGNTISESEA